MSGMRISKSTRWWGESRIDVIQLGTATFAIGCLRSSCASLENIRSIIIVQVQCLCSPFSIEERSSQISNLRLQASHFSSLIHHPSSIIQAQKKSFRTIKYTSTKLCWRHYLQNRCSTIKLPGTRIVVFWSDWWFSDFIPYWSTYKLRIYLRYQ